MLDAQNYPPIWGGGGGGIAGQEQNTRTPQGLF